MSGWNFGLKPVPQVARPFETTGQKFGRKCRENPYVPICGLLTVGNLVMAIVSLARGQSLRMNYWLRGRVAMQGLTIVALVVGASRMGELDWGPDRYQRGVHWDLRQLLAQEEKTFLARKSAAQYAGEAEDSVYGKGVLARHSEALMGQGRDSEAGKEEKGAATSKRRGWLGLSGSSQE